MPMRRSNSPRLAHAAIASLAVMLHFAAPANAFSRIEGSEGSDEPRTGIIAVPLPPLPSANGERGIVEEPSQRSTEPEGTDAGETPLSPEDERRLDEESDPANADEPQGASPNIEKRTGNQPSGSAGREAPIRPDMLAPTSGPGANPASDPSKSVSQPSEIKYGDEGLPRPVADLRAKLMEIARTGDIEKLRPYLQTGEDGTTLSFGETPDDPIEFLKSASGDGNGVEILAIMLEVLEAGHAHVQPDSDDEEIFVWPYFTQVPLEGLTKPQLVELFELVTAGDYEAMLGFGAYNFYRLGISPDGRLQFFVAGD